MSISVPPPEYQFTGLSYNPNFWINATSSLTQSVANQLYLRKTVTDSAAALETFNGGINTSFMNGQSPAGNLYLASNLTAGELYLGVDAAGTNGRIGHIHIGDANNLPSGAGIHLNNGTFNASNTNINNGANTSGNVNIMTGATTSGQLNIGNAGGTTVMNVNGTVPININNGLKSNTYDVITAGTTKNFFNSQTGACTIFQNLTAGLNIGNYAIAQACRIGNIEFTQNLMNNGSTPLNGNIDIGSKQTGTFGTIDIGSNIARTGAIN